MPYFTDKMISKMTKEKFLQLNLYCPPTMSEDYKEAIEDRIPNMTNEELRFRLLGFRKGYYAFDHLVREIGITPILSQYMYPGGWILWMNGSPPRQTFYLKGDSGFFGDVVNCVLAKLENPIRARIVRNYFEQILPPKERECH